MSYNEVVQAIADAQTDAQTLDDVVNGEPNTQAKSRLGRLIYTLATINHRVDVATNQANQKLTELQDAINTAAAAGAGANGWNDLLVQTSNGETQRAKNQRNTSIYDFFTKEELTAYKANPTTYDASKQVQAFFDYCHNNKVIGANAGGVFYTSKPINYTGSNHKTNVMSGDLRLKTNEPLPYMLHITGTDFQFLGAISLEGADSNGSNRKTRCGLIIGYPYAIKQIAESECYSARLHINAVSVGNFYDCGVYLGTFTHFDSIGRVYGYNIGSCLTNSSSHINSATFSAVTTVEGDIFQSSTLTVDKLPYEFSGTGFAHINGQMYNINSFDKTAKTITIYPRLPRNVNTGTIYYQQGSVLYTIGNDTSNLRVNTLQAITCGIGADLQSLYGCNISTFISEFLGAGVVISNRKGTVSIGNVITSGYFEGNIADIVYGWATLNAILPITTSIGLDTSKIISLYAYRLGNGAMSVDYNTQAWGEIAIDGMVYNTADNFAVGELTNPQKVHFYDLWVDMSVDISLNADKRRLFAKSSALYVFANALGNTSANAKVTLTAPSGATINNASTFVIDASQYNNPVLVYVYAISNTVFYASVVTPKTTANNTVQTWYDPPSLANGSQTTVDVAVAGLTTVSVLGVAFGTPLAGVRMWVEYLSEGNARVYFRNDTGSTVDLGASLLTVKII